MTPVASENAPKLRRRGGPNVADHTRFRWARLVVAGFFLGFLVTGLILSRDYGVSWDEPEHRSAGAMTWNYIFSGDQAFRQHTINTYGQVFEVALTAVEKALGLSGDLRAAFLMRHAATFLVFYIGIVFFFLLCIRRFKSWKFALLGSLMLVLSPRILADSFYNLTDIAPLSMFIVSFFTLLKLLEKQNVLWTLLHAFTSGVLVSVRIVGIAIPLITVLLLLVELVVRLRVHKDARRISINLLVYLALAVAFTVMLWPTLWIAPLRSFAGAVGRMAHFPFNRPILFLGKYLKAAQLPWYYIPVWVAVTTPVVYTFLFAVGLSASATAFVRHPVRSYRTHREDLLFMAWFLGPLAAVVILHSNLYDGWRHMFFIYPAFVLLALVGFEFLLRRARARRTGRGVATAAVAAVPALGMLFVVGFMGHYHPHENVYFNPLLSANMARVKRSFELDYWGLSYRQGLEYIARTDASSGIRVQIGLGGNSAANFLPTRDRERIEFVDAWGEPDYFLGDYRWHNSDYEYKNECYAVRVCGERIMAVYDLRERNTAAVRSAVGVVAKRLVELPYKGFASVVVPAAHASDSAVRFLAVRMGTRLATLGEFCEAANDSGTTAEFLPALVVWVFDQEHVFPPPVAYMEDGENYVSGGFRFTLLGTDSSGLAGAYVMESSVGTGLSAMAQRAAEYPNRRYSAVLWPRGFKADASHALLGRFSDVVLDYGALAESLLEHPMDEYAPALAFWQFGTVEQRPGFMSPMDDKESFDSAGYRFTLLGTSLDSAVGLYLIDRPLNR